MIVDILIMVGAVALLLCSFLYCAKATGERASIAEVRVFMVGGAWFAIIATTIGIVVSSIMLIVRKDAGETYLSVPMELLLRSLACMLAGAVIFFASFLMYRTAGFFLIRKAYLKRKRGLEYEPLLRDDVNRLCGRRRVIATLLSRVFGPTSINDMEHFIITE